jgi:hypothetical protein
MPVSKLGFVLGITSYLGSVAGAATMSAAPTPATTPEQLLAEHWPLLVLLSAGLAGAAYISRQVVTLYKAAKEEVEVLAKLHAAAAAKVAVDAHTLESSTRNQKLVEDHVARAVLNATRDWSEALTKHTHNEERLFDKIFTELKVQHKQNEDIIEVVKKLSKSSSPSLTAISTLDSNPGKSK